MKDKTLTATFRQGSRPDAPVSRAVDRVRERGAPAVLIGLLVAFFAAACDTSKGAAQFPPGSLDGGGGDLDGSLDGAGGDRDGGLDGGGGDRDGGLDGGGGGDFDGGLEDAGNRDGGLEDGGDRDGGSGDGGPASPACAGSGRVCPLADFGGFYSVPETSADASIIPVTVNRLTGAASCPLGYAATKIRGSAGLDAALYMCTRPHIIGVEPRWAFGGMFGDGHVYCDHGRARDQSSAATMDSFDHGRCAYANGSFPSLYTFSYLNPLTAGASCPTGFTSATAVTRSDKDFGLYYCYRPVGTTDEQAFLFGGAFGSGFVPGAGGNEPVTFNNPVSTGASCPAGYTTVRASGAVTKDYQLNYCVRSGLADRCNTAALGAQQTRTRHEAVLAPHCRAEQQTRTCLSGGTWSAWSGTYTKASCAIEPWDGAALAARPPVSRELTSGAYYRVPVVGPGRIKPITFDGLPYQSVPVTKVFAWLGLPSGTPPAGGWPGVVAVHGGGGTAFSAWVDEWNTRGFAAIAIDTYGGVPHPNDAVAATTTSLHMAEGGPPRSAQTNASSFTGSAIEDHWMYHAVANTIIANSVLRQTSGVNPTKVGLTGISWGSIVAANAASLDHRFAFVIPVYGSGFLFDGIGWVKTSFAPVPHWDPALRLHRAPMPFLWVTGGDDGHFPLRTHSQSAALTAGPSWRTVRAHMPHSHTDGWAPLEIYRFARAVIGSAAALPALTGVATYDSSGTPVAAGYFAPSGASLTGELVYTTGAVTCLCSQPNPNDQCGNSGVPLCTWNSQAAVVNRTTSIVSSVLPVGTKAWFLSVTEAAGIRSSSGLVVLP